MKSVQREITLKKERYALIKSDQEKHSQLEEEEETIHRTSLETKIQRKQSSNHCIEMVSIAS